MFLFNKFKELSIAIITILALVRGYTVTATTTLSVSLKTKDQSSPCTSIPGRIGISPQWKSGWIDLDNVQDFHAGETIELEVGGSASQILVRLLAKGDDPNLVSPSSWDLEVPEDRLVKIEFQNKYPDIEQISVHGGPNPFGVYQFDENNGSATLEKVWKCE